MEWKIKKWRGIKAAEKEDMGSLSEQDVGRCCHVDTETTQCEDRRWGGELGRL